MRTCKRCGTEFKEVFGEVNGEIDPIEECYANNKANGVCRNCCECPRI